MDESFKTLIKHKCKAAINNNFDCQSIFNIKYKKSGQKEVF